MKRATPQADLDEASSHNNVEERIQQVFTPQQPITIIIDNQWKKNRNNVLV